MAGMNAEAEPFVPSAEDKEPTPTVKTTPTKPQQGPLDEAGVELETGGMSGVSLWRPQYRGRVRSYSEQKGFGFISCDETMRQFGRDVFIHRYQMAEHDLKVGHEVIFEVELNKMGHPQARRVRVNTETMSWDMSQMGGYDGYGNSQYYGGDMYGGMSGMGNYNYSQDTAIMQENLKLKQMLREAEGRGMSGGMSTQADQQGPPEVEEMLRGCSGSSDMWEIIEQWGHKFGKVHVVTALYQLGLCRQYEKRAAEVSLTGALVDRLVLFQPGELTADEASKVLWALAILDEVHNHSGAHRFAMKLGEEAAKRFSEFTPGQMVGLVQSLSRLVRLPEEDELVGRITTNFSDYALGGTGALPRFAPHELQQWTSFLKEASGSPQQSGAHPPYNYMAPMGGKGPGAYGPPGSYNGPPGGSPWGPQMGGKPGMPPSMGKGLNPSGGLGWAQGPSSMPQGKGKESYQAPPDSYGKGLPPGPKGYDGLGGKPGMDGYGKPGPGNFPPQGHPPNYPGKGGPGSMPPGSYSGKGPPGVGSMAGGNPGPGGFRGAPPPGTTSGKGMNPGKPVGPTNGKGMNPGKPMGTQPGPAMQPGPVPPRSTSNLGGGQPRTGDGTS